MSIIDSNARWEDEDKAMQAIIDQIDDSYITDAMVAEDEASEALWRDVQEELRQEAEEAGY